MKITSVEAIMLRCGCSVIADAMSVCNTRQALLVKINTDTELYGIGEAFCYGSPLVVGKAIIEKQLAPILVGQDPRYIERLWKTMYWRTIANGRRGVVMAAISGIDIALWDLNGKMNHMPVADLLGRYSDTVPAYASGGFYAPDKGIDDLRSELEGYAKKGYTAVKIKIGRVDMDDSALKYTANQQFGVSYDEDMKRLEIAREVFGKDGIVGADINASWTAKRVLKAKKDFERVNLDWLEEPIVFEDVEGCQRIVEEMPQVSVMGFETEQGLKNFQKMVQNKMVDIVQPDVGWGGGISEAVKIGAMAAASERKISMHSFGSAVHFAASLQVAAAMSNTERIEAEENTNPLKTDIIKGKFEANEKMDYFVSDKPGLGIELDWDQIEKLRVNE